MSTPRQPTAAITLRTLAGAAENVALVAKLASESIANAKSDLDNAAKAADLLAEKLAALATDVERLDKTGGAS